MQVHACEEVLCWRDGTQPTIACKPGSQQHLSVSLRCMLRHSPDLEHEAVLWRQPRSQHCFAKGCGLEGAGGFVPAGASK